MDVAESQTIIRLSDAAAEKLKEYMVKEHREKEALRLALKRTHCMGGRGHAYTLSWSDSNGGDDVVATEKGVRVHIDRASLPFLEGTEVDYIDSLAQSGFKIKNPNALAKCPCGHHDIFE